MKHTAGAMRAAQQIFSDEEDSTKPDHSLRELAELIDRETASPEIMEALETICNIKFASDCKHGEESWYCDSCRHDWEQKLASGLKIAKAALQKAKGLTPSNSAKETT